MVDHGEIVQEYNLTLDWHLEIPGNIRPDHIGNGLLDVALAYLEALGVESAGEMIMEDLSDSRRIEKVLVDCSDEGGEHGQEETD